MTSTGRATHRTHLQSDRGKNRLVSLNLSGITGKTWLIAADRVRLVLRGRATNGNQDRRGEVFEPFGQKKEIIIGGYGKHIGDVELRFALECLDDLMEPLVRAKSALGPSANSGLVSNDAGVPRQSARVVPVPARIRLALNLEELYGNG